MPSHPFLAYRGLTLDRAHTRRTDADLAALCAHPGARIVPFWRGLALIETAAPRALRLPAPLARRLAPGDDPVWLLLGEDEDGPLLGLDLSEIEAGEGGPDLGMSQQAAWVSLRSASPRLPVEDSALLGYLRGVMLWRSRTRHCTACGARLLATDGGHALRCTNADCATPHFPRTDPAVIVLVTDPLGRALLGRQPSWAAGMFSCLAGFVEPGETLEETVAREVFEESGIRVHDVRYVASQPWPFPASLMVGFTARSAGGTPVAAPGEIEEVVWVSREEAERFGEPGAPGRDGRFFPAADSIARHLIESWRRG